MCRWFAYISPDEPTLLADALIFPANALAKQCSQHYLPYLLPHGEEKGLDHASDEFLKLHNNLLNMDGFGIAYYTSTASAYSTTKTGMRPALYKSQSPPFNDFNVRSLCDNTETTCLFAHIRATSGSVVTPVNCHPFVFGRHTFMHNGILSDFTRIRRDMSDMLVYDAYENVKGTTDSEHAAGLYMTFLCGDNSTKNAWEETYSLEAMKEALQKTIQTIVRLQHKKLGDTATANSLNFCVTDGERLAACRFLNHKSQQPPSLYWSKHAGTTLNRKFPIDTDGRIHDSNHGTHTIISSEPTTFDEGEWYLIGKNNMLLVDSTGIQTEVPLEWNEELNARL